MNNLLNSAPGFYVAVFAFLSGIFVARFYYKKYIISELTQEIENYSWRLKMQDTEKCSESSIRVINIESHTRYKKKYQ